MVTGTRTGGRPQKRWIEDIKEEEVIFARQWNVLKTGISGRRSPVQLHCRQPTLKEKEDNVSGRAVEWAVLIPPFSRLARKTRRGPAGAIALASSFPWRRVRVKKSYHF